MDWIIWEKIVGLGITINLVSTIAFAFTCIALYLYYIYIVIICEKNLWLIFICVNINAQHFSKLPYKYLKVDS